MSERLLLEIISRYVNKFKNVDGLEIIFNFFVFVKGKDTNFENTEDFIKVLL